MAFDLIWNPNNPSMIDWVIIIFLNNNLNCRNLGLDDEGLR